MHAGPPVPEFFTMTLAAKPVGFLERNTLSAGEVEIVPVCSIVTVQTPAVFFIVSEFDFGVHVGQGPAGAVHRQIRVAGGAWEEPFGNWRRRHLQALFYLWLCSLACRQLGDRCASGPEGDQAGQQSSQNCLSHSVPP